MWKYHCLNPISNVGLQNFSEAYEKTENLADADAVLVRSAAMHEMDLPENLKAVARAGAGVNNIPLDQCAQKGIVVFNTPGANANAVKEIVLAGMLLASRDIVGGIEWVKQEKENENVAKLAEKQKKKFAGCEISGKKLGIIGLGAIGVLVANAAVHLGMEVYGYDPYISVQAAWNLSRNIKHISNVEDIYRECDYITIHVPLMDSTKNMIDAQAVSMMKEGAVLLNFARDLLVDEKAVLEAIEAGKIKRYVTDFPNTTTAGKKGVIVIPHLGASTEESEDNCAKMAVKELKEFLENGNIQNSVNYPSCDMGPCATAGRIAICHKNVKNMISQFTTILSGADTNIINMTNKSRGDYAYSLFDIEPKVSEETVARLAAVDGVFKVRVVK